MKDDFLTIKEASQKYEVSVSTITRLARQSSKTKFVRKEKGKYLVSDSFLSTNYEKAESKSSVVTPTPLQKENGKNFEVESILKTENEYLKSQIDKKDSQILEKDRQINKLLQRQFEQNTIIQTMQNKIETLSSRIDNGVKMLSESVKENKTPPPIQTSNDNSNFGFTIATAVMIILLVVMIIVYLTVK